MNMNIDYISNMHCTGTAVIHGRVKHLEQSSIVINSEIVDEEGKLLCSISNIMFISGELSDLK